MGFIKSKDFFRLGENDVFSIVHFLYYIGFPIILFKAFQFGKAIKLQSIATKIGIGSININQANFKMFSPTWFDSFKGFISGLLYLIVILIAWKLICELILIFFRYFEGNTKKD